MINPVPSDYIAYYNAQEAKRCPFPTGIAHIDFKQLQANIRALYAFLGTHSPKRPKLLIPLKANAYGHGMLPVAQFLARRGLCDCFGVASVQEAFYLRDGGITHPILHVGYLGKDTVSADYIIAHDIEQAVCDLATVSLLEQSARFLNKKVKVHLLVDTGMGRCGVLMHDFKRLLDHILAATSLHLVGVMTHFATADSQDPAAVAYTHHQIAQFHQVQNMVQGQYPQKDMIFHAANSASILHYPESAFDMVRAGIAVYGYCTDPKRLPVAPIMEISSRITAIKQYPKDHGIGYGCTYSTKQTDEVIAIVPIGYADGLNRALGNTCTPIVHHKQAKSVGHISMDQCAIRVDEAARVGDPVYFIGKSGTCQYNAQDMAQSLGTICYEVLCNLGNAQRIRHHYRY